MGAVVIVALLVLAQFFFGLGLTVFSVGQVSARQAVTPDHLLGRMNATMAVIAGGVAPIGGLLGGALGGAVGRRATLALAAVGELLAAVWLLLSPLRSLRRPAASAYTIGPMGPWTTSPSASCPKASGCS